MTLAMATGHNSDYELDWNHGRFDMEGGLLVGGVGIARTGEWDFHQSLIDSTTEPMRSFRCSRLNSEAFLVR